MLGEGLLDAYFGFSFSNIHLFSHGYWAVGINLGGADVFDMIFITGLLAVIVDGILVHHKKSKEKHS